MGTAAKSIGMKLAALCGISDGDGKRLDDKTFRKVRANAKALLLTAKRYAYMRRLEYDSIKQLSSCV